MSRNNRNPRPDLQLNLALAPARERSSAQFRRRTTVRNENDQQVEEENNNYSSGLSSEEDGPVSPDPHPMVLTACPRCFMYVMLPRNDLKCPKCKKPLVINEALTKRS